MDYDGDVYVDPSSESFFTMNHVTLAVEDTCLLQDVALVLRKGHRYGIVGENGAGKTSLMLAIRNWIESQVEDESLTVMYVGQNDSERSSDCALSSVEYCVSGDQKIGYANRRLKELEEGGDAEELATEIESLLLELEVRDADGASARADDLLTKLGFPLVLRKAPVSKLSGGWRTRLEVARALFAKPDLLMLDEPTNHLDLSCVLQLASMIRDGGVNADSKNAMTTMVVSHDASFMDMVCTDIISIHKQALQSVPGNYANFEQKADEYRLHHERLFDKRQKEESRVKATVQHQKAVAHRGGNDKALKQAASHERKANDRAGFYREDGKRFKKNSLKSMDATAVRLPARAEPVRVNKMLTMRLPECDTANATRSYPLISLDAVTIHYPGQPQPVLVNANASVHSGDRIALVGKNGAGKTSIIRAISEDNFEGIKSGTITRNCVMSVIDQNQLATLEGHLHESSVQYLRNKHPLKFPEDEPVRAHLARFGLGLGEVSLLPIEALSGGLRVRLILADVFSVDPLPDVLLMDEPTNHLDFESITALGNALKSYKGAVLTVSHNSAFILDVCTTLWVCKATDPKKPLSMPKELEVLPSHGNHQLFVDNFKKFARGLVPAHHQDVLDELLTIRATRYSSVTQRNATMSSLLVG